MTVLSLVREASVQLIGQEPTTVFSTTDQTWLEMRVLMNKVAEDIAKAYDWPVLTKRHSFTGDGTTEGFAMPSDYDRMMVKGNIYSTRSQMPLARAVDLDQWLEFEITPVIGYPGYWVMLGGQMQIKPPPNSGEEIRYYYISKNAWAGNKQYATADSDTFLLPERLVTLGLIWRYRQMKRLEYGEDLQNYNIAMGEEMGRAKGSRMLSIGRARTPYDAEIAYPGTVTG